MTHTLHRQGSTDSLEEDFVLLMLPAPGYNVAGSADKLRRFLDIVLMHDPVNFGVVKKGNRFTVSAEELKGRITEGNCVHAVFRDRASLEAALRAVKEADLGISVTATGLFQSIGATCEHLGITPHTVQYSLGIWGDQGSYRPAEAVLDVITMCGHGLVPAALVERLIEEIHTGERSPEAAATELARICGCGVFNQSRAAHLMHAAAHEREAAS